jgi:hypothetical protein
MPWPRSRKRCWPSRADDGRRVRLRAARASFTSPRLRGRDERSSRRELEIQAQLEFRVRGSVPESSLTIFAEAAPHPNPLPAKSGEKEQTDPAAPLDIISSA